MDAVRRRSSTHVAAAEWYGGACVTVERGDDVESMRATKIDVDVGEVG
jgi:hypothetical protein